MSIRWGPKSKWTDTLLRYIVYSLPMHTTHSGCWYSLSRTNAYFKYHTLWGLQSQYTLSQTMKLKMTREANKCHVELLEICSQTNKKMSFEINKNSLCFTCTECSFCIRLSKVNFALLYSQTKTTRYNQPSLIISNTGNLYKCTAIYINVQHSNIVCDHHKSSTQIKYIAEKVISATCDIEHSLEITANENDNL